VTLSVVVCSHNGAAKLPIALLSLAEQSVSPQAFEVIVVDDGSHDRTSAVAAEMGARAIRLETNAGLAAARNAGVSAASGDIVAFTDDDCEVAPDWAQAVLDAFADPTIDAVGGRVVANSRNPFMRRFLTANNPLTPLGAELLRSNNIGYRLLLYAKRILLGKTEVMEDLYSVVGANMAFRRPVLYELDGFDEAFRFGGEEEELCLRAHARLGGARIKYVEHALVTHWFEETSRDSIRRARAYGRGNARRFLKHRHTRLIVFPAPVATGLLLLLSLLKPRRLLAAAGLPLIAYPGWIAELRHGGSPEPLVYPYVQLAQETANMIGEYDGLRAGYVPVPSRHLSLKLADLGPPLPR
jgi:glycosyltransferase involved in cell wall biosynthesis